MTEIQLQPHPPYSLARSARWGDATRVLETGVLRTVINGTAGPLEIRAWQRQDGGVRVRFEREPDEREVAQVRFLLAVDADLEGFLAMADDDPLLRATVSAARGLRPIRTATVAHAALKAVCGQLITAREAALIERRIIASIGRSHAGLAPAPTANDLRSLPAHALVRCGLAPRRAAALARLIRTLDLERLHEVDTAQAVVRIERERTLGPWSAGVITLYGLGRFDHGLVGDLGLIRLCANLHGRPATVDDTRRLLDRYAPWSGLAGLHLMRHPLAHRRTPYRAAAETSVDPAKRPIGPRRHGQLATGGHGTIGR